MQYSAVDIAGKTATVANIVQEVHESSTMPLPACCASAGLVQIAAAAGCCVVRAIPGKAPRRPIDGTTGAVAAVLVAAVPMPPQALLQVLAQP